MQKNSFSLALVTGATSGIGEAVSRLLAQKGIALILTGRQKEKLDSLSAELKVPVETVAADLSLPKERAVLAAKIRERVPDLVINNAGLSLYGDLLHSPKEKWTQMIQVNVEALTELSYEAIQALTSAKRKGVILNVASAAARVVPFPGFTVYSASKAFVVHLSESLDAETRAHGIRVLASCPGVVATALRERAGGTPLTKEEQKKTMTAEFAAEQIWWQIERRRPVYIFNWKYRLATLLTHLLPKKWVATFTKKSIDARIKKD